MTTPSVKHNDCHSIKPHLLLHNQKSIVVYLKEYSRHSHFELIEPSQTITADFYCQQLDRVSQFLIEK